MSAQPCSGLGCCSVEFHLKKSSHRHVLDRSFRGSRDVRASVLDFVSYSHLGGPDDLENDHGMGRRGRELQPLTAILECMALQAYELVRRYECEREIAMLGCTLSMRRSFES